MRALVTGGAGFIGSHLVKRLLSSHTAVTVLDDFNGACDPALRKASVAEFEGKAAVCCGDIRDRAFVERVFKTGRFDVVFHLAARTGVRPSINDPEPYLTTNINGTLHLLEAARRTGVRQFIFASSSSVYGASLKVPFNENDPVLNPISPYAMTKLAGEQLCSIYANLHGLRTVCLRLFTVYGPRQRRDLAISTFTR
ncbi:MAG TPA: SDR family NAD(P)-dependent oxidoreductase, partial [Verrucomicrobiales bacterium]|nr:SDR family NAD(P)-dependent oxidoreductase [Verrucomicrobiales bacterium]